MSTNYTTWDYVYKVLVDSMNEAAFSFCKGELFPICDYKVLEIQDVRPIDLTEKLIEMSASLYSQRSMKSITGTVNWYINTMRMYFDQFLGCKKGSRAEKYKNRAMELMSQVATKSWSSHNNNDILLIFLAILHDFDDFDKIHTHVATDVLLSVDQDDAQLIKKVWENLTPMISIEKKGLIVSEITTKAIEPEATKFAYIISILYLTLLLQERGVFSIGA